MARARWGTTTLDAIASETRRIPLSPDLSGGGADLWLTSPASEGATVHVPTGGQAVKGTGEVLGPGDHALAYGERVEVTFGALVFELAWAGDAEVLVGARELDGDYARILGMTAVVHGVLVMAALDTPRTTALDGGIRKLRSDPISVQLRLEKPEPKAPARDEGSGGQKAPRPAGESGARDKPRERAAPPQDVRNTGLLALLHGNTSMSATSVFARGGMASGLAAAMAGLDGAQVADPGGLGGMHSRGIGPGGGGTVGIGGGLGEGGRIGGPGGPGGDITLGNGGGPRGPSVTSGKRIEVANISRDEIARVIRRHLPRFKHCYERELNANPHLSGKVAVQFTIAPTGRVARASASESTIDDDDVERCVVEVMESLHFPVPKGGGVAVVTYPFVFASAGL